MTSPRLAALRLFSILALTLGLTAPAAAWVYPEHRDIAALAVESLDGERRAVFEQLWRDARTGRETRLCEKPFELSPKDPPDCIDWAAFAAIAGDHSCSSRDMMRAVLETDWILDVAVVAWNLRRDLAALPVVVPFEQDEKSGAVVRDTRRRMELESVRAARINALRTADTRLQRADPDYATRAGSNGAHFLLPRPSTSTSSRDYATMTLRLGSETNATGVYGAYHLSAMQKATRLAQESLPAAERSALALAVLADEAFAVHFLQDMFASGHVAGTWGDPSQRKGTHDHYNAAGLEAFLWRGGTESVVLMGDAHMRPEDARRAAATVRTSLEQVLDHASGRPRGVRILHTPGALAQADAFDVCRTDTLPRRDDAMRTTAAAYQLVDEVIGATPVPGLGPGLGSMPRFRAEVGPFVGLAGTLDARRLDGAFVPQWSRPGWTGGVDLSVRAGFGLDGVMGESGDGLVFASIGLRSDSPSSASLPFTTGSQSGFGEAAQVPARLGVSTRIRMPFALVPGDLLLAAPLLLVSPQTYGNLAVAAGNGGLIPWQAGWATAIGRFQIVAGRELGVTFYGRPFEQSIVVPGVSSRGPARQIELNSVYYDLPLLEYRPYRAFDTTQSAAVVFQLFAGWEVPGSARDPIGTGARMPELKTIRSFGVRVVFDWRHYL